MSTMSATYDLAIIGGGINGAGIARDAAGRGLKVLLCEQDDLAAHTSSASTKLIHGGLRYLEYYEFRLVREALMEREVLLAAAPHIIWPLRFVLPHHRDLRPRWMLRAGLFLYDNLGGRKRLKPTAAVSLQNDPRGAPLREGFTFAFEYADCWVDDARLVALNAMDARARGASIRTRTRVTSATPSQGVWHLTLQSTASPGQAEEQVSARIIVNAAGPFVDRVLSSVVRRNAPSPFSLRLIRGSHILVDRLYAGDHAYIFQNKDGRIIFTIPYEGNFTLIGTTDVPHDGDPGAVSITPAEQTYLCAAASEYFRTPITEEMVRHTYSGVRPLHDDAEAKSASAVTRDYVFDLAGDPPLLSIYGGKITTFRRLAESALEALTPHLPGIGPRWTASAPLPGGDMADADFDRFAAAFAQRYPFLPPAMKQRLPRLYGTLADQWLAGATGLSDLGPIFGPGLSAREVDYLYKEEFARTAKDVLWRRTKVGLHMTEAERAAFSTWFSEKYGSIGSDDDRPATHPRH